MGKGKERIAMNYGLQLYSIRDITKDDLDGALRQVAEMGYKFVEFAGFFGHSAQEVTDMLSRYGLTVSGTHTGLQALVDDFDGTVAYHKAIGCKNLIIPWADLDSQEKLDAFIQQVNDLQPRLAAEGIRLGYHNHAFEFLPNKDGSRIYEQLLSRTQMDVEIDTYWAYVGGNDPVELMQRLSDRLTFIHIKDGDPEGKGTPLGMGQAPCKAVYRKAAEMGVPMVVESETCTPDGPTEARICIDFLNSQEAG